MARRSGSRNAPVVQAARIQATTTTSAFSGPIPSPSMLQGYEDIIPGAAERILRMAEQNGAHRRELEDFALRSEDRRATRGMFVGAVVVLAVAAIGGAVAWHGQEAAGIAIVGMDIATPSIAYIWGTESRRRERKHRLEYLRS